MRPTQRSVVARLRSKSLEGDEVKTPCEERLGPKYCRKMPRWTEKSLKLRSVLSGHIFQ